MNKKTKTILLWFALGFIVFMISLVITILELFYTSGFALGKFLFELIFNVLLVSGIITILVLVMPNKDKKVKPGESKK